MLYFAYNNKQCPEVSSGFATVAVKLATVGHQGLHGSAMSSSSPTHDPSAWLISRYHVRFVS